jgi:predicted ATPase
MPEQLWGSLADTWFSMMQSHVAHSADPDTMTPSLQDAENEKFLLFMTLKQMLECFLEREPLILMIDDLMYADETSLALTEYLAQQLLHGQTTYPLLILGLFRNEDVHTEHQLNQFLLRLSSPHCLYHIYDLKPLTREDVIDIATAMLGLPPAEEALEQLMIQSQGIPFFVEELLKAWSEDKQIAEAEDRWYLLNHAFAPEGSSPKLNDLPLALQKRLEYRIQRLTPEAFELATHIAICGQEVSFDLLIAVIQWSEGELLSGLEQLLQHKILLEDWTVGIERYRFAHPEIQKTLSKKLEASQRRKLHLVVAQALKQTGQAESSFELLAHHFLAAEDIGQGSWYLLLAAEQQLYAFAHRSCGELLNRCQTLLQTHVEDPLLQPHSTLWLRYHLARCEWYEQMGNYRTGIQCVEQALSDYPPHLDRAALWRWQAAFYRRTGNYAESLKVIQKALTDTPSESEWRALILQEAGRIYRTQGKQSAALETLREALAWAIAKQLHSQQGRLYGLIGEVLHQRGEYIEAFAYYQLSLDTARQHHDLYGEIEALCRLSALSLDRAETSDALEHTEQAIDLARKISARYAECLSLSLLGRLQFARRLYEEAQATFREALSIAIELGTMRMESQLLGYIGMIFFAEQRWPSARIYLEEGLQKAVRIGDPTIELRLRAYLCALDVVQQHRHTDDVASDFQRILKQSERMELLENTLLCRILMAYIWRHLHQLQRSREQLVSARYLAHLIGHKRFLALIEIEFYQLQCIVNAHNYSAPPA